MTWQLTPHVLPTIAATLSAALVALYAYRRRETAPGGAAFALLAAGAAIWSLFDALEMLSADLPSKILWAKLHYVGVVLTPGAFFAFVWQYTHHERRLSRRALGLLAIHPVAILLAVFTTELHRLHYATMGVRDNGEFIAFAVTYGPVFWLHVVYAYTMLLVGSVLLVRMLTHYQAEHLFGRQAAAMLFGMAIMWAGNALYVFRLNPFPALDVSAIGFTLGSAALAWGIFQHGLLDVVPVAHDAIVRNLVDAIVVLDADNRIVELNPSAEVLVGRSNTALLGQSAEKTLFTDHPELVRHYTDLTETRVEITLGEGAALRYFDVKISPLRDRKGHLTGRVLTLHDVTEHKIEHAALTEAMAEAQRAHEALTREHAELMALKQGTGVNT
jgi:PAS domain S-box-containing protein